MLRKNFKNEQKYLIPKTKSQIVSTRLLENAGDSFTNVTVEESVHENLILN